MKSDDEGFWYPLGESEECTNCGRCEKVCPILNNPIVENHTAVAYACINKDDIIRQESSSGGIFSVIAESVIVNHGVVFGAGFNGDFNVLHSWTDTLEGLGSFRGSKYVQSCIGDTYKQAKDFLEQGRKVLFSGTPCQIAGLRSYLSKDYEGLVCLDIICHGVPSPLVWEKYRRKIANEKELKSVNFRDKTLGWKKLSLRLTYNKDEYIKDCNTDQFMKGFIKNVYLRPSCYNCEFKKNNCKSDITLADFWGIENILPSFDNDRGTSLILVNSRKGGEKFSSVIDKIDYAQVDINQAILYNSAAIKSSEYYPKRAEFFAELSASTDIHRLIAKYTRVSFSKMVYLKIRAILGQIKKKNYDKN